MCLAKSDAERGNEEGRDISTGKADTRDSHVGEELNVHIRIGSPL